MFEILKIGMEVRLDKSYNEMRAGDCLVMLCRGQKVTIVAEHQDNDRYSEEEKAEGHHMFFVQWDASSAADADMKALPVKWTAMIRASNIDPNSF